MSQREALAVSEPRVSKRLRRVGQNGQQGTVADPRRERLDGIARGLRVGRGVPGRLVGDGLRRGRFPRRPAPSRVFVDFGRPLRRQHGGAPVRDVDAHSRPIPRDEPAPEGDGVAPDAVRVREGRLDPPGDDETQGVLVIQSSRGALTGGARHLEDAAATRGVSLGIRHGAPVAVEPRGRGHDRRTSGFGLRLPLRLRRASLPRTRHRQPLPKSYPTRKLPSPRSAQLENSLE